MNATDGHSPSQRRTTTKHLSPSDVRRREARKIARAAMDLKAQPKSFRFFQSRLNPRRAIFESPNSQQDLNVAICCCSYDVAAMEHSGGRLSVMNHCAADLAADLESNGWLRL